MLNSPSDKSKTLIAPDKTETLIAGKITVKNLLMGPAPNDAAASSTALKSVARKAPVTVRKISGKVKTICPNKIRMPDCRIMAKA